MIKYGPVYKRQKACDTQINISKGSMDKSLARIRRG